MAVNWPGHLSYDSVIQLLEGRTGDYSGWHPPVMSWLLGLGDAVLPGAALYMICTAALFFGSIASLPWLTARPSWWAVPLALLMAALPQLVLYQAIVWKDVLFANAAIAGFILLAHAGVHWPNRPARYALLTAGGLCLALATLARQNGVVLLPFAGLAVGWTARRQGASQPAALATCILFWAAALVAAITGRAALAIRVTGDRGEAKQIRLLEFYDLNGALAAEPKLPFPDLQRRDPQLLASMRSDGRQLYSPARSDFLVRSQRLQSALANAPDDVLHRSWRDYVGAHPLLYFRNRAEAFRWVLLTPEMRICVPYVVGLRGPADVLNALGAAERVDGRDKLMGRYAQRFVGTAVFAHATFLVFTTAELLFLLWRRRSADIALGCLLLGTVAFALSFFFISIACDYRYLYLVDMAALTTLLYLAISWRAPASRALEAGSRNAPGQFAVIRPSSPCCSSSGPAVNVT